MPSISGRITETGLGGITLGIRSWGVFSFGRGRGARRYHEICLVTQVEGMVARGQVARAAVSR